MKILNYKVRCSKYDNPNSFNPYYYITLELENHSIVKFNASLINGLHDFWINEINTFPGLTDCDVEAYDFCKSLSESIANSYKSDDYNCNTIKNFIEEFIKNRMDNL